MAARLQHQQLSADIIRPESASYLGREIIVTINFLPFISGLASGNNSELDHCPIFPPLTLNSPPSV